MSDIRSFFKRQKTNHPETEIVDRQSTVSENQMVSNRHDESISSCSSSSMNYSSSSDIANFISLNADEQSNRKLWIDNVYVPNNSYNFKADAQDPSRPFKASWLKTYTWMTYSQKLKGVFCLHCVLFKPTVCRGILGGFIIKPYTKLNIYTKMPKNT